MNCGAEKHKNLMNTVPCCSISVLKNMAFFGGLQMVRSRLSFAAHLSTAATQDFFAFAARALLRMGGLSLRISRANRLT